MEINDSHDDISSTNADIEDLNSDNESIQDEHEPIPNIAFTHEQVHRLLNRLATMNQENLVAIIYEME